ncbi:MAG: sugar nucleotide-binding protein [Puia sp.]
MKIVLFGSNGMLGTYLRSYLKNKYEVKAFTRKDLDLASAGEFKILDFLRRNVSEDDVVINACGVIKQRDYDPLDMILVNSVFPHLLAKIKTETGCEVIHISTDCVYSGKEGNYSESDPHDCTDDYGKSKSLGENDSLTIIRTSIIGEEKANKKSLLEWVRSNKSGRIDGYKNHLWNGVTCLELSRLIAKIISTHSYWNGVRHVYSPEIVSKFELVNMINDVYHLGITIRAKETNPQCFRNLSSIHPFMIDRPLFKQIEELKEYKLD